MIYSICIEMDDKSLAIKYAEDLYWKALERGDNVRNITINGKNEFRTVYWYSKYLRG